MFATKTSNPFRLSLGVTVAIVGLALAFLANPVSGQSFKVDPIAAKFDVPNFGETPTREERAEIKKVTDAIKAAQRAAADGLLGRKPLDEAVVKEYLDSYELPKMTQTDSETLANMGELRSKFVGDYLSAKVKGASRTWLIEEVLLPRMTQIAAGNYHPAVRMNAVLLVGAINGVEPDRSTLPRVSPAAIGFLVNTLSSTDSPEFLKVAAMTGIHRNALFDGRQPTTGMDPTIKTRIESLAAQVIKGEGAGQAQWSAEVSYWLRRRSVQSLGFMKNASYANELIGILGNPKEKTWIRLDAANALVDMPITPAVADSAVMAITNFASQEMNDTANQLIADLEELVAINLLYGNENLLEGQRRSQRGVRRDQGPKVDLANYQLNQVRRRVKAIGFSINQTIGPIGARATPDKQSIAGSTEQILMKIMKDIDEGLVDLAAEVEEERLNDLELLQSGGANEEQQLAIADKLAIILRDCSAELSRLTGAPGPAPNPSQPGEGSENRGPEPFDPDQPFG